jgi:hypothetical protein
MLQRSKPVTRIANDEIFGGIVDFFDVEGEKIRP